MAEHERTDDGRKDQRSRERDQRPPEEEERGAEEAVEVIAASTVRIVLLFLGIILLLYATGQVVGFDALAMLSEALDTREARWTIVALFALVLIAVSLRGFRT